jgi:hypothetical protein
MPVFHVRRLIGQSSELAQLRARAQRLEVLQQAYVDCVPVEFAALTKASRVGYIKGGTLYVMADDAATAAKLRHLLTPLVPFFNQLEKKVTGIKVVTQAKIPYASAWGKPRKTPPSVAVTQLFEDLAHDVRDPRLKSALANFGKKPRK